MGENNCHNYWFCVKESENWREQQNIFIPCMCNTIFCAGPIQKRGLTGQTFSFLASVENELKFREKLQTMYPALKSLLRGKTDLAEAAIASVLSLVIHDKSAHSTNQANLFDYIVQRVG